MSEEYASRRAWRVGFVLLPLILLPLFGTGTATTLPSQNACDGVLRSYGRCEQNLSGVVTVIPAGGVISPTVNFATPFSSNPFINISPLANPFSGLGQFNDVLLSDNGTRTGGVCIGCSTFAFPVANTFGLLPSGSGYLTLNGGDFPPPNNFPSHPTFAMININIVTISNLTSKGRNIWIQAFDPDFHGDLTCVGQWEDLSSLNVHRPGLIGGGAFGISNWGAGFLHGDTLNSVSETGVPSAVNQTIVNDIINSFQTCNTNEDMLIRTVGIITSGHETVTFSQLYVTFFYPIVTGTVTLLSESTTSFVVTIEGPVGLTVTFAWKAFSEAG